jgi:hypothetical protein
MHGHGDRCGVWQQRGVEGSEKVVGSLLEAVMAVPLAAQQIELAGLCVCGVWAETDYKIGLLRTEDACRYKDE